MAEHEIFFTIPNNTVFNTDVVFQVRSGGEKLGELHISKGSIDWYSRNARIPSVLTWEQFDRVMSEHR